MSVPRRIEACVRLLDSRSLDCLVGIGGHIHNFLLCEPTLVLAGFRTIGPSAAVLDRDGKVTLIVSPAWDAARAKRTTTAEVRATNDLPGELAKLLAERKLKGERVGYAGSDLVPSAVASAVLEVIGKGAINLDVDVREIDRIRSAEELENAKRATEIAEKGHERLLEIARPGMAEYEFAADIMCHMKGLGAEDNFLLINSSSHHSGVAPPGRRIIQEGDLILAEITPSVGWQFSQICRTVAVGKPSSVLLEKFAILDRALEVGLAAAKPGTTVAATANAINGVLIDAGYKEFCGPPYMRVRGHGLGNLSDIPGDIDSDNQTVLEENMFFVMHPNQYLPETGYLMCGEPVRIAKDGAVPLSTKRGRIDWVPA